MQLSFVNRAFPAVVVKIYNLSSVGTTGLEQAKEAVQAVARQLSKALFVILVTSVANIPPAIHSPHRCSSSALSQFKVPTVPIAV